MPEEISWKEYASLRPGDWKKPEYKHLWLLLYWPVELVFFMLAGRLPWVYHPVCCPLDEQLPLLEGFVVPYLLWFVCGAFVVLYTLRWNIPVFRKFMRYLIVTITLAGLVFLIYPNTFPGRPVTAWPVSVAEAYRQMPRKNVFSWMLSFVYFTDPPRNVFPSEHVVVSLGMMFSVWRDKRLRRPAFFLPFAALQLLICVSVLFVKQHSVLDILGAMPVTLAGYFCCFFPGRAKKAGEEAPEKAGAKTE